MDEKKVDENKVARYVELTNQYEQCRQEQNLLSKQLEEYRRNTPKGIHCDPPVTIKKEYDALEQTLQHIVKQQESLRMTMTSDEMAEAYKKSWNPSLYSGGPNNSVLDTIKKYSGSQPSSGTFFK